MKNIFRIFLRDFKKIFTNSMAIVLIVGVALLPSLYAWFNIYANWDPYGSTGNMMVAVINNDEGTSIKGIKFDIGEQIVSNLKANDAIDWQFLPKEEAISGIESGKYYAAIEIPSGFSESFTSIMTPSFKQPEITYYANEKKNAIATKITDKVVQMVQTEVNESFVITVVNLINNMFGTIIEESGTLNNGVFGTLQNEIGQAKNGIIALQTTLDSFSKVMELAGGLDTSLNQQDINSLLGNTNSIISNTEDVIKATQEAAGKISGSVDNTLDKTSASLEEAATAIRGTTEQITDASRAVITKALESCTNAKARIVVIKEILEELNGTVGDDIPAISNIIKSLEDADASLDGIITDLENALNGISINKPNETADKLLEVSKSISNIRASLNNDFQPKLRATISSLLGTMNDVSTILSALQKDVPALSTVIDALGKSVEAGDGMMDSVKALITTFTGQLDDLSDKLDRLENSEILNTAINLTTHNADDLGEFIACPVKVTTDKIYGIDNYGSAMAPFYSTLAIWVGGTILVAIIKTDVKKKKEFTNLKPSQEYLGRGLTFLTLSLVQSIVICAGDLFFLKIQCYHPVKFMIAGIAASVAIMFFIYSLTYTFGDIGKALAIIMLVVQIGGSGGTFPIDVTPQFFRAINPYLPFTFVIEAMRECVCGLYENDFWIYLLKLGAYVVISLIMGIFVKLLVRKPVKFFVKRIEKTGLF